MKKYVLTGGPGIGKTTVIEILASMGYKIVPESARIIIEEEKAKGGDALPWINLQKFQDRVAELQIKAEDETFGETVLLDRGIVDGYAYSKLGNVPPSPIITKLGKDRYEKIFVLDPLENYELDGVRYEDLNEARKIHSAIIEAYIEFGYEPIFVPVLPPQERVKFILDNL